MCNSKNGGCFKADSLFSNSAAGLQTGHAGDNPLINTMRSEQLTKCQSGTEKLVKTIAVTRIDVDQLPMRRCEEQRDDTHARSSQTFD